jgi:mono/diheme cytochrome c family protein
MRSSGRSRFCLILSLASAGIVASFVVGGAAVRSANAGWPWFKKGHHHPRGVTSCPSCAPVVGEGAWFWSRSPEQERQAVISLFTRFCIRCHGVDGRGVWDIPGVPNFADRHWQATRPDDALARSIIEGRGAVMPPFRGALTYEEACAMARYLRTFVPGSELPPPDRVPTTSGPAGEDKAADRPAPGATRLPPLPASPGSIAR